MLAYLLKRLLYTIPIALGVTFLSFVLVYIAPGDPLNAIAPADAPADVIESLKVAYGLDRPMPVRYGLWLVRALHGDLGASIATGRSVASEVGGAVGNTLRARGGRGAASASRSAACSARSPATARAARSIASRRWCRWSA